MDVTESSQTVTITAEVSDDISGIQQIYGWFYSPSGQNIWFNFYPSGDELQQVLTRDVIFNENIESGTWSVDDIGIQDQASNWAYFNTQDMVDLGFETR